MATLLHDIGTFLADNHIVTANGVDFEDFYMDFKPDEPDNVVIVTEYPGSNTQFDTIVHRSVQIMVRDLDPDVARSKAVSIYNLLIAEDGIVQFTETRWGQVYLRQSPFRVDTDAANRVMYAFNAGISTTIE